MGSFLSQICLWPQNQTRWKLSSWVWAGAGGLQPVAPPTQAPCHQPHDAWAIGGSPHRSLRTARLDENLAVLHLGLCFDGTFSWMPTLTTSSKINPLLGSFIFLHCRLLRMNYTGVFFPSIKCILFYNYILTYLLPLLLYNLCDGRDIER